MTFETPATLLGTYALVWTANVKVLSVSIDRIELAATWERQTRGEDGQPEKLAGESGARLTLREGERALLDFADRTPRGEPLCARNFALELRAEVAEDPTLAARQIGFEIWLVHQAPGGKKVNRHVEMSATQGQESSFRFPGERLPVLAGASPEEPATELQIDVKGTVRGRMRPDGSLDLSLGAERTLWYVSSGEHPGDGGQKILHVQPGETIRVELPGATRSTQRPERYARDLAGHSFALILTAKPL